MLTIINSQRKIPINEVTIFFFSPNQTFFSKFFLFHFLPKIQNWVKKQISVIRKELYVSKFDVGIEFVGSTKIKELNFFYFKKNKETDIISVPLNDVKKKKDLLVLIFSILYILKKKEVKFITEKLNEEALKKRVQSFQYPDLGSIYIGASYVSKYCIKNSLSFQNHLQILLCHGMCHLLGYVHKTKTQFQIMKEKEDQLLKILKQEEEKELKKRTKEK